MSVRTLMVVVLVLAVGLGWYVRRVHIQQEAVAAIWRAGGRVGYDQRWGSARPNIIPYQGNWPAPQWLADLVSVDYVANVVFVDLSSMGHKGPNPADDETPVHVGRLGHLSNLDLDGTAITDADLAHLEGLTGLRNLRIDHTLVSDAGLAHLKGMTNLMGLYIAHTRVTDDGVLELERALPRLWINRDEDMFTPNSMTRLIADLDFARSQPVRQARAYLGYRAQVMKDRRDYPEFVATVGALCDLEADDTLSLIRLAEARAGCLGFLAPAHTPGLTDAQRQALQKRCTDRAIEALTRAIERGYDNLRRLDGDFQETRTFGNLRDLPAFQKLVTKVKAKCMAR